eukprot:gnl/TRDRNA2_/TRDRNA2_193114_c0_seq1.p1 gnl/TRDRNA2_/TRDRNA2_193114_c0~~gnl/TRDRNA2_/TRDRNA2_193114_c0_seq1.p1  ORF type:complete len:660 (-),score=108.82 gnl/TRDRNA2_/TRDRNA2_193114_c0_seq1:117-2057(-)
MERALRSRGLRLSLAAACGKGRVFPQVLSCRASATAGASSSAASSGAAVGAAPSVKEAARLLADGFAAQANGRLSDALQAYREVQRAASPHLRALGGNAEGLLMLRTPVTLGTQLQVLAGGGGASPDGSHGDSALEAGARPPLEACAPGDLVLAPWAKDGGEYPAHVVSVDDVAGECVVDWTDGDTTHRVVPLAAVTSQRGGVCACVATTQSEHVRQWAVRRTMRRALEAWELQAELGYAHDAYVDCAGISSDTALAEVRAALRSSRWLDSGLKQAKKWLQRASFTAERAYKPDARALATLCMHRAELARLTAAASEHGVDTSSLGDGTSAGSLREALVLHERAAGHLALATWRKPAEGSTTWNHPVGGGLAPQVVHELLWAKALASQAAQTQPKTPRRPTREVAWPAVRRRGGSKVAKSQAASSPLVVEACPAKAAADRAWNALYLAAGEKRSSRSISTVEDATRLAGALAPGAYEGKLLLEVAVLTFAMACKTGQAGTARSSSLALAQAAAHHLSEMDGTDDASAAARHVVAALGGPGFSAVPLSTRMARSPLLASSQAATASAESDSSSEADAIPRGRWRIAAYNPLEELWILRLGGGRLVHLPAPPPLTWCIEGVALSETAPELPPATAGSDAGATPAPAAG